MLDSISEANSSDAEALATLINSAYRGEVSRQGWTTEADLLDGLRTTADEVAALIVDPRLRLLCYRTGERLLGCVLLTPDGDAVSLSMLAVMPTAQGDGIGKCLLAEAERLAYQLWRASRMTMWVVACREELIAFYLRRGYRRSGEITEFPDNPELWTAKVDGLSLERLEKRLPPP